MSWLCGLLAQATPAQAAVPRSVPGLGAEASVTCRIRVPHIRVLTYLGTSLVRSECGWVFGGDRLLSLPE